MSSYCAFNINHSPTLNRAFVIRRNEILRQVARYRVYFSDTKVVLHLLTVIILVYVKLKARWETRVRTRVMRRHKFEYSLNLRYTRDRTFHRELSKIKCWHLYLRPTDVRGALKARL